MIDRLAVAHHKRKLLDKSGDKNDRNRHRDCAVGSIARSSARAIRWVLIRDPQGHEDHLASLQKASQSFFSVARAASARPASPLRQQTGRRSRLSRPRLSPRHLARNAHALRSPGRLFTQPLIVVRPRPASPAVCPE